MLDILIRLREDAGRLTLATLLQEREAAAGEIERLRAQLERRVPSRETERSPPSQPVGGDSRRSAATNASVLMRLPEVCALLSVSRSTVYAWTTSKRFPMPVRVSVRSVRWRREDVLRWLAGLDDEQASTEPHRKARK